MLGRVPTIVPKVTWTISRTENFMVGGRPVVGKELIGRLDNSAYPGISVEIQMTVVTPAHASKPAPVMMMFGGRSGMPPAPGGPPPAARGFGAGRAGAPAAGRAGAAPAAPADPPATEQLIADGWGYASINPTSIQADNGAGLTKGIIGLVNKGQPRKPDDWGSLRAWAWGAARGLDYLETDKAVDAKQVGIEGVSRYGKAALVTMAFDPRFAVVLIGSSGEGGAKLHRRNWGEAVENLTGSGEYHWMAGNFLKYGAAESTFGSKNAGDIPVDAHELLALCAPRLTLHQLRRARTRRCQVARSSGQLHGCRGVAAGVPSARREGPRGRRRLHERKGCLRSTSACSTASSPGASTTAATPTARTGSTSFHGRTNS